MGHSHKDTIGRIKEPPKGGCPPHSGGAYPANSAIGCIVGFLKNPEEVEQALLTEFSKHFKRSDCGKEYFEGNVMDMQRRFYETVFAHSDLSSAVTRKSIDLEDDRVRCNACDKTLLKNSWKTHQPRCKETPKNTCKFCKKTFAHQPSYSRHQKTCKHKPVPEPEPVRRFFGATENVDSYVQEKNEQFKYLVVDVGTLMDLFFSIRTHAQIDQPFEHD